MGLFKSEAERRVERNLQIKKGIREIQKSIKKYDKSFEDFRKKAIRAKQIGDVSQLNVIKSAMKRTLSQRRMLERQELAIETALQMKDQAESVQSFAASMKSIAQAIGASFSNVDLTGTLAGYEEAMSKAETMQDQVGDFLDTVTEAGAQDDDSAVISDDEIDAMIEDEALEKERGQVDERISSGLDRIRKKMGE